MSKFGVGVGDDFPVDDGRGQQGPQDDRAEFEEWKRRRDAWRAQRDAWKAQREEWRAHRDEWRDRRRAWREQMRAARDKMRAEMGADGPRAGGRGYDPYFPFHPGFRLWRLLWIAVAIELVVFALSHIGVILVGMLALAALFFAYHHFGHDPLDLGSRDYSRPMTPPPPAASPPATMPPAA